MAESTLSIGWVELQAEVGFFLGYGRTEANWSTAQAAEIELIVNAGLRRVYFPQTADKGLSGYEWSWLRATTTLNLGAAGTDGAITSTTSFDSDTFSDWETQGITTDDYLDVTAVGAGSTTVAEYSIASVAAGAITLDNPSTRTGTTTPADGTSLTFRLVRSPANYALPDATGRIVGDLHYAAAEYKRGIGIVSVAQILEWRAQTDVTGYADFAAIRYSSLGGAAGSRQEILLYPRPDAYKVLSYQYEAYTGLLTDSAPYPPGGMQMSELYTESCLAVAEQRGNDEFGIHNQLFQTLIAEAIKRDRSHSAQNYGDMGYSEVTDLRRFRRGLVGSTYSISYDGSNI